jgi:hypothetical protein
MPPGQGTRATAAATPAEAVADIPAVARAADTPAGWGAPAAASASAFRASAASACRAAWGAGAAMAADRHAAERCLPYEGTVRWDSARPILDAMKSPLPEAFEGRYVISVSGIPLMGGRSVSAGEDDDSAASRRQEQDDLDRLKGLSSLQPKGKDIVQAGVVARQIGTGSSFLFGFSREMLPLDTRDTDILFTTQLGRLVVKAHFLPKEMLYHGDLAT